MPQVVESKNYKWVALTNTTIGMLMVTINSSILLIALPDIFRGIELNPLSPGNTSYFLWILMGFLLVTSVLVVSFGRVGDIFGRVKMYTLGFAIFTVFSVLLSVTWMTGPSAATLDHPDARRARGSVAPSSSPTRAPSSPTPSRPTSGASPSGSTAWPPSAAPSSGCCSAACSPRSNGTWSSSSRCPFGVFGTLWAYFRLHDNGDPDRGEHRLDRQHRLRRRARRRAHRDRLRSPALRRPHHGVDQPLRAGCLIGGAGRPRRLRDHRAPRRRPDVPAQAVPQPVVRHGQPGRA